MAGTFLYLWDFGDGTTSTEQNPTHTYAKPGTYTVTLTTVGPGGSSEKTAIIVVRHTVTRPALKIYAMEGGALSLRAVIDAYSLLTWTRRWSRPGEFSAVVNRYATGAEEIQADRYVMISRNGTNRVARIETIDGQMDENGEASEDWQISGNEVGAILAGRLCLYGTDAGDGYDRQTDAAAETAMRHYVDANAIHPDDPDRTVPGLALELVDRERGGPVTVSARFDAVSDILTSCSTQSGIGWRVDYEFDGGVWRFHPLVGTDRSGSVILSPRLGNANVSAYRHSVADSPSVVVAAGQGEGAERQVVTVGSAIGWARRETFADARDQDSADGLTARGEDVLAEQGETTTLELEHVSTSLYEYGTDFDLGDIVRGEYPGVAVVVARIVAVEESYPSNRVVLTLGTEYPDLISILRTQKKDSVVKRT